MDQVSQPRQWQQTFCPHCQEKVSKSTYYRHREKYYDVRSNEWEKAVGDNAAATSNNATEPSDVCQWESADDELQREAVELEGMACPFHTAINACRVC